MGSKLPVLIAVITFLFNDCNKEEQVISPFKFAAAKWDTSFTIKTLNFPDSVLYNKSIVNIGNTYRFRYFFNSLNTKKTVKIGFIGGSITAGCGTSHEYSYAQRFCTFLNNQFPENKIVAVNAGVSATDSRYGCSRIEDDLLSKKPDMVIIEYAVNDNLIDSVRNRLTEEGLVRRCLNETDGPVMYLLLTNSGGEVFNQKVDSIIGSYYGLPVISYQNVCWPELQNGNILWGDITADAIHPNDKGHLIISYLLYAFVKKCFDNYVSLDSIPLPISAPLRTNIFENADIFKVDNESIKITSSKWAEMFTGYDRKSFWSAQNGSTLILNCNLHELTLGYSVLPNYTGQLEISINDIPVDTITNTGSLPNPFLRLQTVFFDTNTAQSKKVTLKTLNDKFFELNFLMFAR